jgi:hypothetical protein
MIPQMRSFHVGIQVLSNPLTVVLAGFGLFLPFLRHVKNRTTALQ